MNASSDSRRVVGALRFLAELSAIAAECADAGMWDDELTARRRQRESVLGLSDMQAEELQVKAL
ncbi:MAG: hypothetical protein JO083_02875 [Candidatus Eremiobacteraeota bacterium]|nr:hypothetical protein [Candidatus Eremiobacteraeota bacterium]MBV8368172.1 hypothetical protein [Candidatus Eremiobacteraeota bacterium]